MNSTDLNAEKSCEEKSICRNNSASLYPPPRPPRHRRGLSSGGHGVEKEQRRSGNHAARSMTGSLQESLSRSASNCQDQYYFLRSDIMNGNNNNNQCIGNQLCEVRTDEYGSVKVPKKRISFGSCRYMFVVVLVNIAVIACVVILIQLLSDWRGSGNVDFQKSLRFGGFADRVMREAKFGSVADVLYLKNTEP